MTFSIYEELVGATGDGLEIRNKLIDMDIAQIFDYAWNKHHPAGNFKCVVLYTAHTYSWESKLVRIGGDWLRQKIKIAQKVELPQYLYDDTVHLKDAFMVDTFSEFLYLYRDNMDYIHLTSLKELYQQVMSKASRFNADEEGNDKIQEKLRNIKHASDIKADIALQEAELTARYRLLSAPKSDFKFDHTEHGNPLKIENSNLIRG